MSTHSITLADIPILDWKGPDFLAFYLVALGGAALWSWLRARRISAGFRVSGNVLPDLTDPYEIAYLAGGARRVVQLAVVRLVNEGAVAWKKTKTSSGLVGNSQTLLPNICDLERTVWKSINSFGVAGMPLQSVPNAIGGHLSKIESRLAFLGLRPTASEHSEVGLRAALPLVLLLLIGITKLVIGLHRDKPVFFLILLLFGTALVFVIIAGRTPLLTPAGKSLLEKLHVDHDELERRANGGDSMSRSETALAISLLGPSCLIALGTQIGLDDSLNKQLRGMGSNDGGGCSSGDGGSGCGGGGCGGGCGGCGGGD